MSERLAASKPHLATLRFGKRPRRATPAQTIAVCGLAVEIVRKDVRNLNFHVYPPDGRVRVSAPLCVGEDTLRAAIEQKVGWIRRWQARFAAQPRPTERPSARDDRRFFLGRAYRLRIVGGARADGVLLTEPATLEVHLRSVGGLEQGERLLDRWYREQLARLIPPLLAQWQPVVGVTVAEWRIRKMKTRWGSCNISARRIWLNAALIQMPVQCLEYVLVHELTHLLERHHNKRFRSLMDGFLPQWRQRRAALGRAPDEGAV
jgi:predicted metal-dependent hydrolase